MRVRGRRINENVAEAHEEWLWVQIFILDFGEHRRDRAFQSARKNKDCMKLVPGNGNILDNEEKRTLRFFGGDGDVVNLFKKLGITFAGNKVWRMEVKGRYR